MSVTVSPVDGGVDLLGKNAQDLQSDVLVSDKKITGTSKYVTGYTGFSSVVEEQTGNYLALKFDTEPEADEVTVDVIGGEKGPVKLDEDRMLVIRLTGSTNSFKVIVTKNGKEFEEIYDFSEVVLEEAPHEMNFFSKLGD